MRVLYISTFSNRVVASNSTSLTLVENLIASNLDISMVTCSADPTWHEKLTGKVHNVSGFDVIKTRRNRVPFISVNVPERWYKNTPTVADWEDAVTWGTDFFSYFKPNIVHLQQWQNLWWMLASAQRLGIPTVYSVNDYGMTCMRTFLTNGQGQPCDGEVTLNKCTTCVFKGRSLLGKLNETIVSMPGGQRLIEQLCKLDRAKRLSSRFVNVPIVQRVALRMERSYSILSKLSGCLVGSPFGAHVMAKNGAAKKTIKILPWFHNVSIEAVPIRTQPHRLVIGFIGRISPEKGLHILLDAMALLPQQHSPHLLIAGDVRGAYAQALFKKYQKSAGNVPVEWLGWVDNFEKMDFFHRIHLLVVPSLCVETGPLSMIESLASKRPVLCTDVPPMRWFVEEYNGGICFPFGNAGALAETLENIASGVVSVSELSIKIKVPPSLSEYSQNVLKTYQGLANH